jgi:predicted dehydrogenase
VVVATSIDRHAEPCRLAIERGLGVLVEKPFASLAEARALVALADAHRVPLVVGQNYRYTRTPQAVRRLLAAGAVGRVGMVVCQAYRRPAGLSPVLARRPDSLIWETAVHHVDALRFMLADEVTGALAESFAVPWSAFPPGASLHGLLVFAGGTRVALCATYESVGHERIEGGYELYMRIVGERGTLHVFQHWLVFWPKARLPRLVWRGRRRSPEGTLLDQLTQALGRGREPESSGRENLRTLAVLEAWSRSARERRWVDPRELLDGDG